MVDPRVVYTFEGISGDLPRPPMAALRALLSAGVLVSARAWQELHPDVRQRFAQAGAAERLDEAQIHELLKQVPVSQVKLVGKRPDPPSDVVPADLAAALGPSRPLTAGEWGKLRAIDRHVLVALVKNTRLLAKALNELLPQKGGGAGPPNVWAAAVARAELRVRRPVIDTVTSAAFLDGRAFVLANVAGRRAARRASEVLDQQADSTVGPVELDWGLRAADDVLFWQAHVSAWDGTFFPGAALLAATTAAAAMYDMIKTLDPGASIVYSGIREEPWQAGRDEIADAPTGLYSKEQAGLGPAGARQDLHDTVHDEPPRVRAFSPLVSGAPAPYPAVVAPSAPSSSPNLAFQPSARVSAPPSSPSLRNRVGPPSSGRGPRASQRSGRPTWVAVAIVGGVVLANLLVIFAIALFLAQNRK